MEECKINVMMFGGRRCGKTSVIAAMKSCIDEKFGGQSPLVMTYDNATLDIITKKEKEIKKFLNSSEQVFVPDEGPSKGISEYSFDVSLKGKKGTISLTFCDYPGEYLLDSSKKDFFKEQIEKSNIFIIAIDTPMLIEEPDGADKDKIGRYNSDSNKPAIVCNTIMTVLKDRGDCNTPPLIIFVPLKCEKYHNENRMDEVNKKVHAAYRPLFDFFCGLNEGHYEVVIAPILTFGENTAQFSRFEDENGDIKEGSDGLPEKSLYIKNSIPAVYSPMYCEQPLLYALGYLLHIAAAQKEGKKTSKKNWLINFFKKLFDSFYKLPNANDFLAQKDAICQELRKDNDGDGYEIVYDPMELTVRRKL